MTGSTQLRRRLRLHPSSVGVARRLVGRAASTAGRDDLVDSAQLLVSELVTNALLHAGTHVEVTISAVDTGVVVLVSDGSAQPPRRPELYRPGAETGHGLFLVDLLASAWGTVSGGHGKLVWFELDSPPPTVADLASAPPPRVVPTLTVELLDMPVSLSRSWPQHARTWLREHLLIDLTRTPKDIALHTHAAASSAVALLAQHLAAPPEQGTPRPRLADHQDTAARVMAQIPPESVDDFRLLADLLIPAECPPGVARLRPDLDALTRWLCEQVHRQSLGLPPTPWKS